MSNNLIKNISKLSSKLCFKFKKHSPEILIVTGVIGTVTGTVLACKATTKVNEILTEKNNKIADVHACLEDETVDYTVEDSKKDLTIIYTQTAVKIAKLYAPAVLLETLSLGGMIASNVILKKRNIALAAAYFTVDKSFKNYRNNVIKRFGENVDRELKYNLVEQEVETKVIDKNGKEKIKKEKKLIQDNPLDGISEYARFFDEATSKDHRKDPEYNLMFLRRQQDYANEKLKAQGHLFLNEVYDMLGIPRTKAGQVVGWIYNKENPNGDNYVDFGIYNLGTNTKWNENKKAFVNGYEYSILLDFNVDGVIYDMI